MSRPTAPPTSTLHQGHAAFGAWSLLFFVALGLGLEALHGLKLGWYLDAGRETRRLLLTLGHAHGTLLSVLNLVFALSLRTGLVPEDPPPRTLSRCLLAATVLVPGGFLLGGLMIHGADAGLGVLLVPVGAALLLAALYLMARGVSGAARRSARKP
jgi:hypothetical protein